MKCAIFPGSFDPFHEGHQYLINKGLENFDFIYIIVSWNENKIQKASFSKRKKEIEEFYNNNKNIKVLINKNKLTTDIAKELNCFNIIRGYRDKEDKQYEKWLKKEFKKLDRRIKVFYYKSPKNISNIRSSKIEK